MFTDEHGHEMTKDEKTKEVSELNEILSRKLNEIKHECACKMLLLELLKERVGRRKKRAELLEKMNAGFAPVKVEVNVEVNVAVSVKKRKQSKRRRRRHRKRATKKEEKDEKVTQSEM